MAESGSLHHENQTVNANVKEVMGEELNIISSKRKNCQSNDDPEHPENNLFGIALSGGGIRSATINLGILEIFNKVGILSKADYISTVSGGGFIGGYIHSKLWQKNLYNQETRTYDTLFEEDDIQHLRNHGYYLVPGKGREKVKNFFRFSGAVVFSILLNAIGMSFFILALFYLLWLLSKILFYSHSVTFLLGLAAITVIAIHTFLHGLRHIKIGMQRLWSSNFLNTLEGGLLCLIIVYSLSRIDPPYFLHYLLNLDVYFYPPFISNLLAAFVFSLSAGLFSNPNVLSMHRFYRDRLADAYINMNGRRENVVKLAQLTQDRQGNSRQWTAPYPLINACLNLQGANDKNFKGTSTSDYFLFSPLFCGSKLTGYAKTESVAYQKMTLPTAVAISGAAVNPGMGERTNPVLAFLMALLNLKLGYWAVNPNIAHQHRLLEWWPWYLLAELFSKMDTRQARVNISDGGHIENLAVYELLRRRCKLIIAIDASADPEYQFPSLKNLVIRTKNELDIAINFRKDPELLIRPNPSRGFSDCHAVIADIEELPEKAGEQGKKIGLLVYIKSSLKEPRKKKDRAMINNSFYEDSYYYKTYHPRFPHESTGDQFFDKAQWEAYYHLGKFMAGDILGVDVGKSEELSKDDLHPPIETIDDLYKAFSEGMLAKEA